MPEQEPQQEICKFCGQPVTAHAEDCSLVAVKKEYKEQQDAIEAIRRANGITPEFEAAVERGEITFEKQMQELETKFREQESKDKEKDLEQQYISRVDDAIRELRSKESNSAEGVLRIMVVKYLSTIKGKLLSCGRVLDEIEDLILNVDFSADEETKEEYPELMEKFESELKAANYRIVASFRESYEGALQEPIALQEKYADNFESLKNKFGEIAWLYEDIVGFKKNLKKRINA